MSSNYVHCFCFGKTENPAEKTSRNNMNLFVDSDFKYTKKNYRCMDACMLVFIYMHSSHQPQQLQ